MKHDDAKKLTEYAAIDAELCVVAKSIKILNTLAWPFDVQFEFLENWRKGNVKLPVVVPVRKDLTQTRAELERLKKKVHSNHPVALYLKATIQSYLDAAGLLESSGTKEMTRYSIKLYGRPGDTLSGSMLTNLDAANHFIGTADEFSRNFDKEAASPALTAEAVRAEIQGKVDGFFKNHKIDVIVDKTLASKATAGVNRIRLREGAAFSEMDVHQLWEHEALVHSLTAINGKQQPHLKSMGLGAPRTTATQEGLATFAELITGTIDIPRLKRIALRIIAVEMGLRGADFIQVFKFFLDSGQSEQESYNSSMRVFRGGTPAGGGIVFTKDTVYLQGLVQTHTFLRQAMAQSRLDYSEHLFTGRLTFDDVAMLEPFVQSGYIQSPLYLPPWLHNIQGLAAYLAFSLFVNRIPMEPVVSHPVISAS
jgi:uncharacterized protein (TIGR02421 family)